MRGRGSISKFVLEEKIVRIILWELPEEGEMNANRENAYLNLIREILDCPQEEEARLIEANWELVDMGLVQALESV
jgi:hypothetical protein